MNPLSRYDGASIYIATQEFQRRKHHKRRINKKWRKRYGTIEIDSMPYRKVIFDAEHRILYMTKRTFEEMKKLSESEE
jgi:hypothetical protein